MIRAEVVINEVECQGCGYCTKFCPRGCLEITGERFNQLGYLLPSFVKPEECNTCGFCALLCPQAAVEVYLVADQKSSRGR